GHSELNKYERSSATQRELDREEPRSEAIFGQVDPRTPITQQKIAFRSQNGEIIPYISLSE
ncbi:hypothetical protein ADUPG1_011451, partial [Aduncisulcus paluster]